MLLIRLAEKKYIPQLIVIVASMLSGPSFAVAPYEAKGFVKNLEVLEPSLSVPHQVIDQDVLPSLKQLKVRVKRSSEDERFGPLQLSVPRSQSEFKLLVERLARKGKKLELEKRLFSLLKDPSKQNENVLRVDLSLEDFKLISLRAYSKELRQSHKKVVVDTKKLLEDRKLRRDFLDQVRYFLKSPARKALANKLRAGEDLILDEDLLPSFASRMAKRFIPYRGPNCFHAALAFHGAKWAKLPELNIREEPGYHELMINYDELWRVIESQFYEVDPSKSKLKYGDMIVFFALPLEHGEGIHFRWIRHTATYLFDNYTFSKGSKSPNTPYSVKSLADEWNTWQRQANGRLGVKVYRRNSMSPPKDLPFDRSDWIY